MATPVAIDMGLRTKVDAPIGISTDIMDFAAQIRKAKAAETAGDNTPMELSAGGDLEPNKARDPACGLS